MAVLHLPRVALNSLWLVSFTLGYLVKRLRRNPATKMLNGVAPHPGPQIVRDEVAKRWCVECANHSGARVPGWLHEKNPSLRATSINSDN